MADKKEAVPRQPKGEGTTITIDLSDTPKLLEQIRADAKADDRPVAQPSAESALEIVTRLSHEVKDPAAAAEIARAAVDLQIKMDEHMIRLADRSDKIKFTEAMAAFRDEMPTIIKGRSIKDKQGKEKYRATALEDVATPFMKALAAHGIMYRWKSADLPNGWHRVTCFLRLKGTAYEEEGASMAAPPDTEGGKDALKAAGSCISYLEKYTLLESCGAHVYGSDPEAVEQVGVTNDEGADWIDRIKAEETPETVMGIWTQAINKAKSFDPIDYRAMTIFTEARDARLKELRRKKSN